MHRARHHAVSIPGAQPVARPHSVPGVQGLDALHAALRLLVKHF